MWPRRIGLVGLAALAAAFVGPPAHAAGPAVTYSAAFDLASIGRRAESLQVTGVTFVASPAGSFVVAALPVAADGSALFSRLSGQALQGPAGGLLDLTFASPVDRFVVDFGSVGPAAASLTAEAFDGASSVGQVSATTRGAAFDGSGAVASGESTLLLEPSRPFRYVRLTWGATPGATALFLDDVRAYAPATSCSPVFPPPVLTSLLPSYQAGRRAALTLSIPQPLAAPGSSYLVEASRDASFGSLDAAILLPFDATGPDVSTFGQVPLPDAGDGYVVYARARAESATCRGPLSPPVTIGVTGDPARFAAVSPAPTWSVGLLDPAPPAGTVRLRNVGGRRGRLALSTAGGFLAVSPEAAEVAPGGTVDVTLTVLPSALATPGERNGALVGVSDADRVTVPLSLTVVPGTALGGTRSGTKVKVSTGRVTFVAPAGSAPAPRTITVTVGPVKGAGPVYVSPWIPGGGSWLVLSDALATPVPASGGTLLLTLSVDRSRRDARERGFVHRALLHLGAVGAAAEDGAIVEVIDAEPPAVTANAGAGRLGKPGETGFLVPATVRATGLFESSFRTDGWIRNEVGADLSADLYFTPDGVDGTRDPSVLKASLLLPAGQTLRIGDLLQNVFQTQGSGALEVRSPAADHITVRTTVEALTGGDPSSRYGTEIPAVPRGSGVGLGEGELTVSGVRDDATARTNLILAETRGGPVTASVSVFDAGGLLLGTTAVDVPPLGKVQINGLVAAVGSGNGVASGSAAVKVASGTGRVVALATFIDNRSNSVSAVLGRPASGPAARAALEAGPDAAPAPPGLVLPSAARLTGALDTRYVTRLSLVNGTASPASLSLTYLYNDLDDGGKAKSVVRGLTLPPRGALNAAVGDDALLTFFGVPAASYGWIRVDGDVSRTVGAAAVSTQVDPADPALGLKTAQVPSVPGGAPQMMSAGTPERLFTGAEKSLQKRTNLVLEEVTGQDVTATVQILSAGGDLLAQRTYAVAAHQYVQINDVFGSLGLGDGPYQDARISAVVKDGDGVALSFASVIDNESRNPQVFLLGPAGASAASLGF